MFWLSYECFSILCNAFLLKSAISSHSSCAIICTQIVFKIFFTLTQAPAINNNEDNNRFIGPSFRTMAEPALAYQGIKLWNTGIHVTIKKSGKYSLLSKELKQHLLEGNNLTLSND